MEMWVYLETIYKRAAQMIVSVRYTWGLSFELCAKMGLGHLYTNAVGLSPNAGLEISLCDNLPTSFQLTCI